MPLKGNFQLSPPTPATSLSTIQFYLRNLDPNVTPAPPSLANTSSFSQLSVSSRLSHPQVARPALLTPSVYCLTVSSLISQPCFTTVLNCVPHALAWQGNPEAYCSNLWQELLSRGRHCRGYVPCLIMSDLVSCLERGPVLPLALGEEVKQGFEE